nr:4.8 kDa non-structural protein [Bovine coronavirus]
MKIKFVFDLLTPDDILHPSNHVNFIISEHIIIATTMPAV